ncbi:SMP-30/gluconolactonase/LRE family protein [Gilvimarinus sp. DA14]|uniref:SMP-30/gluconolactonase/LRE family protein n=1 Tax=Gilvimarinus sp. DA14 TaxID=2956798 RepID=UPI0020B85C70|nr:GTP-binding protein [Gilvimarinus sp. DA14]UTF59873.1 GTP-binding protein [Gilvimarinus sp. DA14]
MRQLLALGLSLISLSVIASGKLGAPAWEIQGLRTPESVLVWRSEAGKQLLVSEIEGDSTAADGQGGIALLSTDGEIIDQNFIRGLNAPKGMAVVGSTLYVADITELVAIDLNKREKIASYPVEGAVFLNDVAADAAGVVYVSDTRTGKVHVLRDGVMQTFLPDVPNANGLLVEGDALLIGAGDTLYRARDGALEVVAKGFAEKADGVEPLAEGGYLVSCWAGLVYRVGGDGTLTLLRDTREPQVNTADIGYDRETNRLYIPTFLSNGVQAYSL